VKSKSPVIWIGEVGVQDGKLVNRELKPISENDLPSKYEISRRDTQLTSYGKIENWHDRSGHVFRKVMRGKEVEWVPMHGRKTTRPKRLKVADSAKRGETMFDPAKYVVRA
jgi:hypothetical protein